MKKIISMIIICSLLLIGCSSRNTVINYEGKSPSWSISYKIEGNEKAHDSYYTFRYIGTDNKSENEIKYSIDGPKEGENGKFSLDKMGEYTGKMKITGGLPNDSDRDIRVEIEWDGKSEGTILKRGN